MLNASMFDDYRRHVDALLLSIASSTDNFTVGFSISIGIQHFCSLPFQVNAGISLANATGALLSSSFGGLLSKRIPSLAPILAAIAFGYLAIQEILAFRQSKAEGSREKKNDSTRIPPVKWTLSKISKLALPMTLNNLAGGIAGGAAGLSPTLNFMYAFLSSYLMMDVGFRIGRKLGGSLPFDPSLLASFLLATLCLLTIQEAKTMQQEHSVTHN
jgi:putative Mn2+ efflux pump MntP